MTARRASMLCMLTAGALAAAALAGGAHAGMADRGHRARTADIDLITYPTHVRDVVVVLGALPAGDAMAGTRQRRGADAHGHDARSRHDHARQVRDCRAARAGGCQHLLLGCTQSLEIRAKCLRKDLPMVLSILAAELRAPAFSPAELAKAKQQLIGSLRESSQNTGARAQEAFARAIFPPGHPNRPHSVEEMLSAAESATLEELQAFHAKYIGPKHLTLILAGDVNDKEVRRRGGEEFQRLERRAGLSAFRAARRGEPACGVARYRSAPQGQAEHDGPARTGDGSALP